MKIYNSLTKKVEEFKPIKDDQVGLYTCGPTVYDHVHIGNLRTYVFEDTLRRALKAEGHKLQHVMNVTDVEDKIITRSRETYPDDEPMAALKKLTRHFEEIFLEDAKKIGVNLSESRIVRATEHIDDMLNLIHSIDKKYVHEDGVYYDITKDENYGVLIKLDRKHQHHRINNDEYDKDHVADFALWKKQTGDEPSWDFEIDGVDLNGRPGWHIECSAMSVKYLGQPFDIHTGGVDLKFPHHENEIAQSRAAAGKPLANYFMHAEHLLVDGHKMSKKLNNFYTLSDVIEKGYDPLALRLLFLQAHYRSQLNFTWESLDSAQAFLKRLQNWADLKFQSVAYISKGVGDTYNIAISKMLGELSSDINSSTALGWLSGLASQSERHGVDFKRIQPTLESIDNLFGLSLSDRDDITAEQKEIINTREAARQQNNWSESDSLREQLTTQGLEIRDSDQGPFWSRI